MLGDVAGGFLFWLFRLDVGRGKFKAKPEHMMSAFIDSMSRNTVWQLVSKAQSMEKAGPSVAPENRRLQRDLKITLALFPSTRAEERVEENHLTSTEILSLVENCVAAPPNGSRS